MMLPGPAVLLKEPCCPSCRQEARLATQHRCLLTCLLRLTRTSHRHLALKKLTWMQADLSLKLNPICPGGTFGVGDRAADIHSSGCCGVAMGSKAQNSAFWGAGSR